VEADGQVLEKPVDAADARRMLASLSGARHAVHTGVALVLAGGREVIFSETTLVEFGDLSAAAIAAYVDSGEAEGKAGAYGIQGRAAAFVRRIEGDYFNVVGLPLHALCGALDGLIASGELEL
jgi:septum formation protein